MGTLYTQGYQADETVMPQSMIDPSIADRYSVRPEQNTDDLGARLANALYNHREASTRWNANAAATNNLSITWLVLDQDVLWELSRDHGPDSVNALIGNFIGLGRHRLSHVLIALRQRDFHSVGVHAHALAKHAKRLGLAQLTELCQSLSEAACNNKRGKSLCLASQMQNAMISALEALHQYVTAS